jgi:hypothetical protein
MNLSPMTTYIILFLFVIGYLSLDTYTMSKKIHCTFRRRDNTKLTKWAKMSQGAIEFDGGIYHVRPDRTYQALYTGGLHILVPTWIRCADYRWDSAMPLDPKTFKNDYETPETRKQLNMEEDVRALHEGNRKAQGAAKAAPMGGLVTIILLLGFVVLGYFTYSNMKKIDLLGYGQNVIQQQLGTIINSR